jgi:hypothetical protein
VIPAASRDGREPMAAESIEVHEDRTRLLVQDIQHGTVSGLLKVYGKFAR